MRNAIEIRSIRAKKRLEGEKGYTFKKENVNFLDFFQSYIDHYTKGDVRMIKLAFGRFKDFLKDTPEYNKFILYIKPEYITKDMMIDFTDYLKNRSRGDGAHTIYQRFKKVINYAIDHDIMTKNPCKGIIIHDEEEVLKKDILSIEEEQALINTTVKNQNPNIRRAFIFCLYTGIRYCDVCELEYANVDFSNRLLIFKQNKTGKTVEIPLNDGLIQLIGTVPENGKLDSLIFPLPSYWGCIKALQRWVTKAGINKHITWHCARHSFAVNILNNGANIKTVASLLGHSGLRHTEKYTRAVDELKRDAIDSLPELKL